MTHRNRRLPPAGVRIRPARPADLAAVVALDALATGLAKRDYWKTLLSRYGGGQRDRCFLLAETERPAGFIVGEVRAWEFGSAPCGWILAINVDKTSRLQGLGTQLFEAICARFREHSVEQVRTMVAKDDRLVMAFFRSLGLMAGPFIELEKRLR